LNAVRERAIDELRRIVLDALGDHDAAVWLFGSCARGEPAQHSDIDIAVLPRDDLSSGFFAELAADIEEGMIPYDVDLVDLRHAQPAVVDEVRRNGREMAGLATRLAEAEAALAALDEAVARASRSLMERDSAILRLIYTFEAIWKACQAALAEREDIEVASPNAAIRAARRLGWLSDDDAAAAMTIGRDRNLAVHMYRGEIGAEIEERLASHAIVLRRWLDVLRQRAAEPD
jgi:uncharacterized protein